jgi:hypothetical protein
MAVPRHTARAGVSLRAPSVSISQVDGRGQCIALSLGGLTLDLIVYPGNSTTAASVVTPWSTTPVPFPNVSAVQRRTPSYPRVPPARAVSAPPRAATSSRF